MQENELQVARGFLFVVFEIPFLLTFVALNSLKEINNEYLKASYLVVVFEGYIYIYIYIYIWIYIYIYMDIYIFHIKFSGMSHFLLLFGFVLTFFNIREIVPQRRTLLPGLYMVGTYSQYL